jgi:hypothetical protein
MTCDAKNAEKPGTNDATTNREKDMTPKPQIEFVLQNRIKFNHDPNHQLTIIEINNPVIPTLDINNVIIVSRADFDALCAFVDRCREPKEEPTV